MDGVPLDGAVDIGANITLIELEAFKRIATVRRRDFKLPDKTPHSCNQTTFHIDSRIDIDKHVPSMAPRQCGKFQTL